MVKTIVLSLGGSLIAPNTPDISFLKKLREEIICFVKKGNKVILVCGGGGTSKFYNNAANKVTNNKISNNDLDWLGIAATKINAELIRVVFAKYAYEKVIYEPIKKIKTNKKIIVASGWKPGFSTDYDAVALAINFKADIVVNLTNVDYVYNKDPKKYKDAKKFKYLTWNQYISIVGEKWTPRMHAPFDPIASKLAKEKGIIVRIINGKKFLNIKKLLLGKEVEGTIIS